LRGKDGEGDLTNVQYKLIWNCHNESPLYNEYVLIIIIVTIKKHISLAKVNIAVGWKGGKRFSKQMAPENRQE
jgi:hypothetical protein